MLSKLPTLYDAIKSRHGSSYATGIGFLLYGASLWVGAPRDVAGAIGLGVICIAVPLINHVTDDGD